nr:DUF6076 domain-containing protein [uncultured Anaerocolumna sp.]
MKKKEKMFIDYIDMDLFMCSITNFEVMEVINIDTVKYSISWYDTQCKTSNHCNYDYEKPIYYYWLDIFDYSKYPEAPLFIDTFKAFWNECFYPFNNSNNLQISSIIDNYKKYVSIHPYYLSYFHPLYEIIQLVQNNAEHNLIVNRVNDIHTISETFTEQYHQMKEYIYYALIYTNNLGKIVSPRVSSNMYDFLLSNQKKENIFWKLFYKEHLSFYDNNIPTETYMSDNNNIELFSNYAIGNYERQYEEIIANHSYDHEFAYDLNQLITNGLVLCKCPNCNRYFIKKYNSSATFCTYTFKNTKATCQEYTARKKYHNKLKDNPIQAEFYRVRNRMYMKVKRGSIDSNEAKLELLRELRDEYLLKYDACKNSTEERSVIQEFVTRMEQLYL